MIDRKNLRLYLNETIEGEYAHIQLHFVRVNKDGKYRGLRNEIYEWFKHDKTIRGTYYADMQISNQISVPHEKNECYSYAWKTEFKPFSVDSDKAEAMYKTLKRINNKLNELYQIYGNPDSFGCYVSRVAQIIGVKCVVFKESRIAYSGYYDDYEYSELPINESIDRINSISKRLYRQLTL